MQCGNNKRAVVVNELDKILEIIIRAGNQSVDETAPAFLDAIESIVNRRITIYSFVNVAIFSITLARSYRDASPRSLEGKALWITKQVSILMAAAYHRYHIDSDRVQEQSGWTGVLRLEYQTFTDYAPTGGQRRQAVAVGAGMICTYIITTVGLAAVWYNW